MQWIDICSIDDLQPNSGICALVAGHQVAIYHLLENDTLYAIDNYDPIGKANVLSRGMIGDIKGEPMVASPLFKQHFNLDSGICFEEPDIQVKTFPVRRMAGRVEVAAKP